ncbi:hypothetical protein ABIE44_003004 [Marmoricola sp. OAE513]|uniref:hypothetical protein n=1 Tax=Marmoricola sp. OAE513 TaxID=2817894 RepID=UPI001AEB08A2
MPTKKSKRPNRAAFARAMAEVQAQPQGRDLPDELAAVIDSHNPVDKTGRPMELIRPFLTDVITASTLVGKDSVRKHCTHLTELARFALSRGLELTVENVMTTHVIDEFTRIDQADKDEHHRAERRRRLLALAASTNPGPQTPAKLTPIAHAAIKACYTPAEKAAIIQASRIQPTEARRRDLSTVVACGLGAGMDSIDLRHAHVSDIEDHGPDGLLIHIHGPRPRIVPVRADLETLLREAAAGRKPSEQLLVGKIDRRNTAARATERAALVGVPHIEPARLRATWLADLMTDTVPLALILQAAGLKSARTISELQPHIGPWLEHKGLNTLASTGLRGES